jgi:hypothetical protein
MKQYTNEEKAKIYNNMLFRYQRLQEQARQIRALSLEPTAQDQKKINELEREMKLIYDATQKLYK